MGRPARGAFTLFEVVLATSIVALLMGALLTFFWQSLQIREQATKSAARARIVHAMLGRMAKELRETVALDSGLGPARQFTGTRRQITFVTTPLPSEAQYVFYRPGDVPPPPELDLVEVSYQLWIDPEKKTEDNEPLVGGVLRSERRALLPSQQQGSLSAEDQDRLYQRHDLWAYEFGYLEFRYFDGVAWSTTWDVQQGNALPHLIQITLGFDSIKQEELDDRDLQQYPIEDERYYLGPDRPNVNRYNLIVRLPAADETFAAHVARTQATADEVYGATGEDVTPGGRP